MKLQVWDTAGQERFRSMAKSFYKNADGIFVCFSLTDKKSFENIESWLSQIKEEAGDDVTLLLVGNKADVVDKRMVTPEEIEKLKEKTKVMYFETSAKDGTNVEEAFEYIARIIKNKMNAARKQTVNDPRINLDDPKEKPSRGCLCKSE